MDGAGLDVDFEIDILLVMVFCINFEFLKTIALRYYLSWFLSFGALS